MLFYISVYFLFQHGIRDNPGTILSQTYIYTQKKSVVRLECENAMSINSTNISA